MIDAICSGDLRGQILKRIAWSLFYDLYLMNPESPMRGYFPKVVEFYKRMNDVQKEKE